MFSGEQIVEWNVDGFSDCQILLIAKHMTMFAQAARARNNSE